MSRISSYANKATPVDADNFLLSDSAASNATKTSTWANIKATLLGSVASLTRLGGGGNPLNLFDPTATPVQIYQNNLGSGVTDIYTVPANKRLLITFVMWGNPSASSNALLAGVQVKSGGVYRRVNSTQPTIPLNGSGAAGTSFIFEAGEILAVYCGGVAGLSMSAMGILMPNTSTLKTIKLMSPAAGQQTFYTVPNGKTAQAFQILSGNFGLGSLGTSSAGLSYQNETGGNITFKAYFVPNGASINTTLHQLVSTSVATGSGNNNGAFVCVPALLVAGDSIVVDCSANTAGQIVFMTILEQ